MKTLVLVLVIMLSLGGCATTYNHSENIEVDHFGATGSYRDTRSGTLCKVAIMGAGGGGSASGALGLGGLGIVVDSSQGQSDPRAFAKSIVMVDLSKKLKSIKVDDAGEFREYEYVQPPSRSEYQSTKPRSKAPSAFGRQPIE